MLKHKHYMDIQNLDTRISGFFHEGDEIIIEEKIDGANASFQYDKETNSLSCFSRNQPLSKSNTLRGFYNWVQKLDKEKVKEVLGENLRMFGEWLVPHTVNYPDEKYDKFYCFDVFDTETGTYLSQSKAKEFADILGIDFVPIFYVGKFTKWSDYMPLVGKTEMGTDIGEGIVVKNMGTHENVVTYTKIVHENFKEVMKIPKNRTQKHKENMEVIKERERLTEIAKTIVTRQRVEKTLLKLVDEGIVPENFSSDDKILIYRHLPSAIYYDCIKEEPEIVAQIESFGKYSGCITKKILEEILTEKENE